MWGKIKNITIIPV